MTRKTFSIQSNGASIGRFSSLVIVLVLSAALPAAASTPDAAAASEPRAAADDELQTIGLLAALNAASGMGALRDGPLGAELDRAANGLVRRRGKKAPALEAKGAGSAAQTLGIGAIAPTGTRTQVYPAIYTGQDARLKIRDAGTSPRAAAVFARLTSRVSECYGQPLAGHNETSDRLVVGVVIDDEGQPLAVGVVEDAKWGASDLERCLAPALRNARFPAGVGPVELRYTWTFHFRATDFSFE